MKNLKSENLYWNKFYKNFNPPEKPSAFAHHCKKYLKKFKGIIFDIGCGNGRDTAYLNKNNLKCIGLDLSKDIISRNKKRFTKYSHLYFNRNFSKYNFDKLKEKFVIYSRFTLHSINNNEESLLFENIKKSQKFKILMIEARTIYDELYGIGKQVGKHEYVSSHYRRFIDPDELKKKLRKSFKVISFKVERNFAKFKKENPKVLRVIAMRKNK